MPTLKDWILELADGEEIEAVVIGEMGWGDYGSELVPGYAEQPRGQLLTWAEAEPFLSYEFYDGFGAPGCNAIVAWTPNHVISVYQYDGSTTPFVIPRHPVAFMPYMPGG